MKDRFPSRPKARHQRTVSPSANGLLLLCALAFGSAGCWSEAEADLESAAQLGADEQETVRDPLAPRPASPLLGAAGHASARELKTFEALRAPLSSSESELMSSADAETDPVVRQQLRLDSAHRIATDRAVALGLDSRRAEDVRLLEQGVAGLFLEAATLEDTDERELQRRLTATAASFVPQPDTGRAFAWGPNGPITETELAHLTSMEPQQ